MKSEVSVEVFYRFPSLRIVAVVAAIAKITFMNIVFFMAFDAFCGQRLVFNDGILLFLGTKGNKLTLNRSVALAAFGFCVFAFEREGAVFVVVKLRLAPSRLRMALIAFRIQLASVVVSVAGCATV